MEGRFKPGDRVVLRNTDETGRVSEEKGVVICAWQEAPGVHDCYVAFFGAEWPRPDQKPDLPYILRYYDTSLGPVE